MSKQERYLELVRSRKACRACKALINPSVCEDGAFDSDHLGPWSRWQGNLDAQVLVIGQDWGGTDYFIRHRGFDTPVNPTNRHLRQLLESIGIAIPPPSDTDTVGDIFLTNAILCLKKGGLTGPVRTEWFKNCGKRYLQPLIDLIAPQVVVTLGRRALDSVLRLYDMPKPKRLRDAVENEEGIELGGDALLFPMYHCGQIVWNTHRKEVQQLKDWTRVSPILRKDDAECQPTSSV